MLSTFVNTKLSATEQATPSTDLMAHAAFLHANSKVYESLIQKIQRMDMRKEAEVVLGQVALAAQIAATFHPGRFADGAIENLALEVGAELSDFVNKDGGFSLPAGHNNGRRRVLHVASSVIGIGGHSRMLYHWMQNDQSSDHSLVLVNQNDLPIPQWLSDVIRNRGGDLVVFPTGSSRCQKAKWLRETARRGADLVVLHHGPFDVAPTVAFAVHEGPPVVLLNHADHQFWLGSSVSDMVINLRTAGSKHTEERRFVSTNKVIPIPLADQVGQMSRLDARRELGIPEKQVCMLSIGRAEKYRPCGPYDFVMTAEKILERHPDAHLYVVGESAAGIAPYLRCDVHERLHFVGCVEDPSLYRQAADVYLESFPFGSQTALLEAALGGLPVVPAYAPLFPLLVANDDALQDILPNPHDEQEYLGQVGLLIQEPERRITLGQKLRERLLIDHVGKGWLDRLTALYKETDRLTHDPHLIPATSCSTTDADIGLSLWHVMADGETCSVDASTDCGTAVLCHTSFLAKYINDYPMARQFAWRAVLLDPYRRASWRLLAVTLLGRIGKFIKWVSIWYRS